MDAWRSDGGSGTGTTLAERLAKDLETERVASSLRLKQQREDAERRLLEVSLFILVFGLTTFLLCFTRECAAPIFIYCSGESGTGENAFRARRSQVRRE